MSTRPARYREWSTGNESSDASGSGRLEWTYCENICGVFHADDCKLCEDWRLHCTPLWNSQTVNEFQTGCAKSLASQGACYAQESEELNREIELLTRELQEVNDELRRIEKGPSLDDTDEQSRLQLQAAGKIQKTIQQLQARTEVEPPAYNPPPSMTSSRPRKRPRLTRTQSQHLSPPTMPRSVIWVDSASEGEQDGNGGDRATLRTEPCTQDQHISERAH